MMITLPALQSFTKNVFAAMGCSDEHADLAAGVLSAADLRGIDSHGVARFNWLCAVVGKING